MEETKTIQKKQKNISIIISKNLENKIIGICRNLWDREWSGILFYKTDKVFNDLDFKVIAVDMLLLDVGDTTFTSFSDSPEVINYMVENNELLDCYTGLIHSHHSMNTFFSNIDINTLILEGNSNTHFVSLIVNNKGAYNAAITAKGIVSSKIKYNTFNDIVIEENNEVEEELLYYYPLNIVIENSYTDTIKSTITNLLNNKKEGINRIQPSLFGNYGNTKCNNYDYDKQYGFKTDFNVNKQDKNNNRIIDTVKLDEVAKESEIYDDSKDFEDSSYLDIPYGIVTINKKTLDSLLWQLLTGSVIINNTSKLDLDKWCNNMESIFDKRFNTTYENSQTVSDDFSFWANSHIEFICNINTLDQLKELDLLDEDIKQSICAYDLISILEELPNNKYIQEYIQILNNYIL